MFTKTESTPTDTRTNPFRDPAFRPTMAALPSPEFRRKVEMIIDRYVAASSAAGETTSTGRSLPTGGEPMDILQINQSGDPEWLRKITVSESAPNDDEGNDGDIWIET